MAPLSCIGKGGVIYCLESDRVVGARFPGVLDDATLFRRQLNNSLKKKKKRRKENRSRIDQVFTVIHLLETSGRTFLTRALLYFFLYTLERFSLLLFFFFLDVKELLTGEAKQNVDREK